MSYPATSSVVTKASIANIDLASISTPKKRKSDYLKHSPSEMRHQERDEANRRLSKPPIRAEEDTEPIGFAIRSVWKPTTMPVSPDSVAAIAH